MEKYKKEIIIGKGTFGTVWRAASNLSRISYVIKEIDMSALSDTERQRTRSEIALLAKCKHKNIIGYREARIDHAFRRLSIIMEYADGGDLYTAIRKQQGNPFSENLVCSWFIQITLALQYIHSLNVLHRDLKSQNIFLTKSKIVKVGDFGIARVLKNSDDFANTAIGTPYYLSPEICQRKPYSFKSDMWALGCVLFEMSSLVHPFEAEHFVVLAHLIVKGKRRALPSWCSSLMTDLVDNLLISDPEERLSTDEVLAHPLLKSHLQYAKNINADPEKPSPRHFSRDLTSTNGNGQGASKQWQTKNLVQQRVVSSNSVSSPSLTVSKMRRAKSEKVSKNLKHQSRAESIAGKSIKGTTYTASPMHSDGEESSNYLIVRSPIYASKDIGYQSGEVNDCNSNEKQDKIPNSNSCKLKESTDCENSKLPSIIVSLEDSGSVARDFQPRSYLTEKSLNTNNSTHNKCQCLQCMLSMLWQNRIRAGVGAVNVKDYSNLKDKLKLVFDEERFETVYQSLLQDWEKSGLNASQGTIQTFTKLLNYEQVQHLPLMIQLIQLDLQVKSQKKNSFPIITL